MQKRVFRSLQNLIPLTWSTASFSNVAEGKASFGFRQVDPEAKSELVAGVFNSVADRYDLMNDVMSFGVHRLWKAYYVSQIPLCPNQRHLDVAGGTGDIAFRLLDRMNNTSRVTVCDVNEKMMEIGKKRTKERHSERLEWVIGDAENLPFEDASFDSYSVAFGIRNMTHIEKVLREAHRVLRSDGHFSCLEFSHPHSKPLGSIYDAYSFYAIPLFGQFIAGDRKSYQYLVESIRKFPKQEDFAEKIQTVGFRNVAFENLMDGIVAIHSGRKEESKRVVEGSSKERGVDETS